MRQPAASPQAIMRTEAKETSETTTRLSGRWLILARIGWFVLVAAATSILVLSLPTYMAQMYRVGNGILYIPWQLTPESTHALQLSGISIALYAPCAIVLSITIMLVWVFVAVMIFWRKSDDWMALFVAFMLIALGTSNINGIVQFYPGNSAWQFAIQWLEFFFTAALILFLFLFPDGRFVPGWICWLAIVYIVSIALIGVAQYFFPGSPFNPNNWPTSFGSLSLIMLFVSIVAAQIYRYRYVANAVQREQIKWVVFALAIVYLGQVGDVVVEDLLKLHLPVLLTQFLDPVIWNLIPVLIPISIGIAILRYRLWDIDLIINRTLVYGVLTISIVAFYVLVVVGLGMLLQAQGNPGIALLATGLVAVLFQPLRTRLQRIVNRLMYGDRDDPYRVISRLGQRLEATLAPDAVLPTVVETVAQALKLPYAAITLKQGDAFTPAASYGTSQRELFRLPLIYQTEQVGELVLAPRTAGETFTSADRKLLEDLAHQAGVAAHAVRLADDLKQLTIDLQHSRERLVTAREEERRRLRRDLHDGLGPQLAGLTLKLETARNRLAHDALADTLLSDLTTRTQAAVSDIRRLVYALRPPALDELGLLPALWEQALQYSDPGANGLHIHIETPEYLPELSAAVEVAVYRITQEALTNVVRHAHARHCTVCLALDERTGRLTLEVRDDGGGITLEAKKGVGLTSMRERAEELGGTWTMKQASTGGTCIHVELPYRQLTSVME